MKRRQSFATHQLSFPEQCLYHLTQYSYHFTTSHPLSIVRVAMKTKEHRMGLALSRMKYGCELLSVTFPSCKNSMYGDGPLVQAILAGQEALVMLL